MLGAWTTLSYNTFHFQGGKRPGIPIAGARFPTIAAINFHRLICFHTPMDYQQGNALESILKEGRQAFTLTLFHVAENLRRSYSFPKASARPDLTSGHLQTLSTAAFHFQMVLSLYKEP